MRVGGMEYIAGHTLPLGDDDAPIGCPDDVVWTGKQRQGRE